MIVLGSDPAADNQFALVATDLPRYQVGFFLAGQAGNFSSWFRDTNPGSMSNFPDGIALQFS